MSAQVLFHSGTIRFPCFAACHLQGCWCCRGADLRLPRTHLPPRAAHQPWPGQELLPAPGTGGPVQGLGCSAPPWALQGEGSSGVWLRDTHCCPLPLSSPHPALPCPPVLPAPGCLVEPLPVPGGVWAHRARPRGEDAGTPAAGCPRFGPCGPCSGASPWVSGPRGSAGCPCSLTAIPCWGCSRMALYRAAFRIFIKRYSGY